MTDTLGGIGARPGWRLQDLGRQPLYDPSNGREMQAWSPSWRDRLGYLAGASLEALGAGRKGQQRIIDGVRTVADFVPLLGETLGVDDTARALEGGRYGEAALSGAATLAGMVPIAGDVAGKALQKFAKADFDRAIANAIGDYEHIAIRTSDVPLSGRVPHSRVWVDGEPTSEFLPGVSATSIDAREWPSMHGFDKPLRGIGSYDGPYTYLLGSDVAQRGEDIGELVMKNPVILFGGERR